LEEACLISVFWQSIPALHQQKLQFLIMIKRSLKTLNHKPEELNPFEELIDQFEFRKIIVEEALEENDIQLNSIDAIVSRGGLLRPVPSGVFMINQKMLADLKDPSIWGRAHASNIGAFIAKSIADELHIPCFVADPVTVDEMENIARISGVPGIVRQSLFHALNIRAIARKTAKKLDKTLNECNLVAAHMGGGVSVAAIKQGKVVDVNNALLGMGPFSPQRAGALPLSGVIDMCFSGKYTKADVEKILTKTSGLIGYLGTDNDIEIEKELKKVMKNIVRSSKQWHIKSRKNRCVRNSAQRKKLMQYFLPAD